MNAMADSISPQAKICFTAAGALVHQGKILLIKHKKLGIWLNPGGHIDPGELPHHAAEREYWEETGLKVKAKPFGLLYSGDGVEGVPSPFVSDLHWVSRENYEARVSNDPSIAANRRYTGRDCEQHLNFSYFVEPIAGLEFTQNVEETDGIAWFSRDEIDALETPAIIKLQIKEVLRLGKV